MPLYEYKCQSCGEVFEVIQRFSDQPLKVHERCGGAVDRLLSPPALQFKGTGWYVTDYARSSGNGKKLSETKELPPKAPEKKAEASKKTEPNT